MIKSILVPLEDTEHSFAALSTAVTLAEYAGAEIRALYISKLEIDREEFIKEQFNKITQDFGGQKLLEVEKGRTTETILRRERAVDLTILGRSGKAKKSKAPPLGHYAHAILERSYHPILIITHGYSLGKKILLHYDGSRSSTRALHNAAIFAGFLNAEITGLVTGGEKESALLLMNTIEKYLKPYRVNLITVWKKSRLLYALKTTMERGGADLIITGVFEDSSWTGFIFGNVMNKIIENFSQPLLICS